MWNHHQRLDPESLKTIFYNMIEERTISSYPIDERAAMRGEQAISKKTMRLILVQLLQDSSVTLEDALGVIDEADTTGEGLLYLDDFIRMMTTNL